MHKTQDKITPPIMIGRIMAVVSGVAIGISISLIFWTLQFLGDYAIQSNMSNKQAHLYENRIESLRLADEAMTLFTQSNETQSHIAGLLAIRALQVAYTPQAYTVLETIYPNLQQIGMIKRAHTNTINGIIELADGRLLTYSSDATLHLWSSTGVSLATLIGHTDAVLGALELADGRIVSWSRDNTMRFWATDGTLITTITEFLTISDSISSPDIRLIQLANGNLLTWAGEDKILRLWDKDGNPLATLTGHIGSIRNAMQLSNGTILSWGAENTLWLWSVDGEFITTLEGHTDWVSGAYQLSDGNILTWADNSLHLWDMAGNLLAIMDGHTDIVMGAIETEVLFLGRTQILSWGADNTIRTWELNGDVGARYLGYANTINGIIEIPKEGQVSWDNNTIQWLYAGEFQKAGVRHRLDIEGVIVLTGARVASWSAHELFVWSKWGNHVTTLSVNSANILGVMELSDGRLLSWDSEIGVHFWNLQGNARAIITSPSQYIEHIIELPTGNLLTHDNTYLYLLNADGTLLQQVKSGHDIEEMMLIGDTQVLAYGYDTMRLWDIDLKHSVDFPMRRGDIQQATELSDGNIVTLGDDGLCLWNTQGELLKQLINSDRINRLFELFITPDGRIGGGTKDNRISVFDMTGNLLYERYGRTHTDESDTSIFGAVALHDGRILSWSTGEILLWDTSGNLISHHDLDIAPLQNFIELTNGFIVGWGDYRETLYFLDEQGNIITEFHHSNDFGITFLKNGTVMTTDANLVYLWDMRGNLMSTTTLNRPLGQVKELANGNFFTSSFILWSPDLRPISLLFGHVGDVDGVIELTNGNLLSWSEDNTIRLWDTQKSLVDYACEGVIRDFYPSERLAYQIGDHTPTCPQFSGEGEANS